MKKNSTFRINLFAFCSAFLLGSIIPNTESWADDILLPELKKPTLSIEKYKFYVQMDWDEAGRLMKSQSPQGPFIDLGFHLPPLLQLPRDTQGYYKVLAWPDFNDRPFPLYVPPTYNPESPAPLLIGLHGLGGNADLFEDNFSLKPLSDQFGFLYARPQGTEFNQNSKWWNSVYSRDASDQPFDVDYLSSVIYTIKKHYAVDPDRVYIYGVSNGGMMAYRMACEKSLDIAAIFSNAGSNSYPQSRGVDLPCQPEKGVHILHLHGTEDYVVPFYGGGILIGGSSSYQCDSVTDIIERWATINGCSDPQEDESPTLDMDQSIEGLDTIIRRFENSTTGYDVELWKVIGGTHDIVIDENAQIRIIEWLLSKSRM